MAIGKRDHIIKYHDALAVSSATWSAMLSLGALLSRFGVELWFMPHRRLRGIWWVFGLRVLAAYGWSIVLFFVALASRMRSSTLWTTRFA